MFRRLFLPRPGLLVALALATAAVPGHGRAQDFSTQERLDRLERDLNMLQRQVYRGAPPPTAPGGDAVNAEVRMEHLETQMRDLTGRVEEVMNQVQQLRQRLEQVNSDVDVRLGQGGSGAAPRQAPPGRPGMPYPPPPPAAADSYAPPRYAPGPGTASLVPPGTTYPPSDASEEEPGGPAPIFGTLTPPGAAPTGREAGAAPPPRASTAGTLPGGSATEQYNHAFGLVKQADYPGAEAALKAFVAQHPNDPMAGNAQYWLGETYFARGNYAEAASAFAEGYKRYPKSSKAADGLLKLGMSLARANQTKNACVAFAQLDHDFPHQSAAVKERAAAERKRIGC